LAVLPIEVEFYRSHGVPTTFVGHPFFDAVADQRLEQPILDQLEARRASGRTIAVLPGSRTHEVHSNWPIMLQSIQKIHQSHPQVRFAVAGYREKHVKFCRDSLDTLSAELPIDFYQGCTSEIIEHADLSMMVSGSVSLEMMARRTPSVVIYRVGRFLYAFGKCVIKVDSMTLPNLMPQESDQTVQHGDERVFPEIVSVGDTRRGIDFLTDVTRRLLDDQEYQSAKRLELDRLAKRYASPGASVRAASLIGQLLQRDTVGDTHQLENATQDHPRVSGSSR
ncbi:MAG: lipid-A-disaccharide synthase, partial [Planctomycetota bacterium]